ncbi:MAG: feoB [Verrucomicrobiales bacterium]|nr:feoB [Verrucomicrobiales bacterium]
MESPQTTKPNSAANPSPGSSQKIYVALTGNPNCGKTTLFNALTGLRAKVGNYAGVTVERKEGKLIGVPSNQEIIVIDLPGTYSLSPQSLDEQVSRDILFGRIDEVPEPALIVLVADGSNLQRNLYYATQVIELGYPVIVALNMIDVAEQNGHHIDVEGLSAALGVPVVPIVASKGQGVPELRKKIASVTQENRRIIPRTFCELPEKFGPEVGPIADLLTKTFPERRRQAAAEALLLLSDERTFNSKTANSSHYPEPIQQAVVCARERLEAANVDWRSVAIEARYARASAIQMAVTTETDVPHETFSDKLDRVLTHKMWGMLIFVGIMALMFQTIFSFAQLPMNLITSGVDWAGGVVGSWIPNGALHSLIVNGVIAGVGAVVVFLPQICLLFMFISLLEDTGYMARAAFLMDRLMSRVGLHGKSFIPMLSSFACAIPGIMATRTIESPKDRLTTILVAPLMSCSARLPVYTLLIAACIPDQTVFGIFKLGGLTMLSMYLLGIFMALGMAWLLKKTLLKGAPPMLIMELPPYKIPVIKVTLRHMWDRSKLFLVRAGTVILGINIVLWFLASYPKNAQVEKDFAAKRAAVSAATPSATPELEKEQKTKIDEQLAELDKQESGESLRHSFAGHMGRAIEPLIKPLGFDWKIGIGLVASFAAREVFVSTMSTVYNVGSGDDDESNKNLTNKLREQKRSDGTVLYTPLLAISLMVFYVLAMQCFSTMAVVRRETNGWKWVAFQWGYMAVLAWVTTFAVYHGGKLLGFH